MNTFLKIWESVGEQGKFGIGFGIFILALGLLIGCFCAFDATIGKWAAHRWPDPRRADEDDLDEDDD